jgi:starch synthase
MEILHISAECYPIAKAGGLGDVVGALPKYQNKLGHVAQVVMPMYRTKFLNSNEWDVEFKGSTNLGHRGFDYTIIRERTNKLGFELFLVDIYGLLDREKIYGYDDDVERFAAFQIAVVHWLTYRPVKKPDVVHCHDHQAGLIPFMMKYCYDFSWSVGHLKTVLTIHNAQYQGWVGWDKSFYVPRYDNWKHGMLEWQNNINSLASGIKCADKVTTVSPSYLEELRYAANGLENLFEYERGKCVGILNGIDTEVWNPAKDTYIDNRFSTTDVAEGKLLNKRILCEQFDFDINNPLIVFIGRLVGEKAADILPDSILASIYSLQHQVSFLILGSGEPDVEWRLNSMTSQFPGNYNVVIGYNEKLSHQMYAGADFLLMPSRVEPCGLNQMYALRYGTVPMVRSTGGLRDTVIDMGEEGGYGIRFIHASVGDVIHSVHRAAAVFKKNDTFNKMRVKMMEIDNSWDNSALQYINLYQNL